MNPDRQLSHSSNYSPSSRGYSNTFDTLAENTLCFSAQTKNFFSEDDKKHMMLEDYKKHMMFEDKKEDTPKKN